MSAIRAANSQPGRCQCPGRIAKERRAQRADRACEQRPDPRLLRKQPSALAYLTASVRRELLACQELADAHNAAAAGADTSEPQTVQAAGHRAAALHGQPYAPPDERKCQREDS